MKSLLFVLLFAQAFVFIDFGIPDISKAIGKGDVETLATYFDENVEVALPDVEDIYSKSEAKSVVKAFFAKNSPKSFTKVHEGASKGKNSRYCIGNLDTSTKVYRVYVYVKIEGQRNLIQELRFDEE